MEKLGQKIWKGSRVMVTDAVRMVGCLVVMWKSKSIDLMEWWANQFSLMSNFNFLELGDKGTLVNVYGPSYFPQKQDFMNLLNWMKGLAGEGSWIICGYFNLIISLR